MPIEVGKRRAYYIPAEVAIHNCAEDCWVSIFHKVYDLTKFIQQNRGPLAQPIIEAAGEDISHWFDKETGNVKNKVDDLTNLELPHLPNGRFLHVPPTEPTTVWRTNFGTPWWKDQKFCIGNLSEKTRTVEIVNILTQQRDLLTVCSEETINEIRNRYIEYNAHAASYTWKHLQEGEFVPLNMELTLTDNGMEDESDEFERLSINDDYFVPVIHLYFNDDLTVQ
jgi:hypothetical protein